MTVLSQLMEHSSGPGVSLGGYIRRQALRDTVPFPSKYIFLPLLSPTVPGPAAQLLYAPPPGPLPKTHLNRMDGWCRSLPNPEEETGYF